MVKVSDGQTDLVSTLLQTSQDAQGKKIKWVKEKTGGDDSLPTWSAEGKNDDGSKSIFSLSLAKAIGSIGVNTELSSEQKKAQEERGKKTNIRDGNVVQNTPQTGKPKAKATEPDSKEDKEAEKRAEKESESGFRRR
jgi:hypothetical protein